MSADITLFGWDQPMKPTKAKRGQPKGNAAPIGSGPKGETCGTPPKQEARFWAKVDKRGPDECWIWKAGKFSFGYGAFRIGGKLLKAHRVAWAHANGQIPGALQVCHRCDNPPCCNPAHLFLGTGGDNMRDKTAKGRNNAASGDRNGSRTRPERVARGEAVGNAKLTAEKVIRIRAIYAAGGVSQDKLGAQFGVSQATISFVILREIWKHI